MLIYHLVEIESEPVNNIHVQKIHVIGIIINDQLTTQQVVSTVDFNLRIPAIKEGICRADGRVFVDIILNACVIMNLGIKGHIRSAVFIVNWRLIVSDAEPEQPLQIEAELGANGIMSCVMGIAVGSQRLRTGGRCQADIGLTEIRQVLPADVAHDRSLVIQLMINNENQSLRQSQLHIDFPA